MGYTPAKRRRVPTSLLGTVVGFAGGCVLTLLYTGAPASESKGAAVSFDASVAGPPKPKEEIVELSIGKVRGTHSDIEGEEDIMYGRRFLGIPYGLHNRFA